MKKTLLSTLLLATLTLQGCSTLSNLIEKPDSEKSVEEFYQIATEAFQEGQWDTAIQSYEKLKSFYPYGAYAEQSYTELAYAYYRYDEPESAIRELEEFIRLFPKHPEIAYAYYLRAVAADSINRSWLDKYLTDPASRDSKSTLRAFRYYSELLNKFPESRYVASASKRLIVLRNQMARHELQVAQYYFNKQAYLAAANRAQYIVEHYPRAAVTLESLAMLEQAYEKLGMTENLADVKRVYELNRDLEVTNVMPSKEVSIPEDKSEHKPEDKPEDKSWWSKVSDSVGSLFD
ncbi:outer membrane protein assembly factor BamD [Thiomicrorhabdus arctica]|uniref:outer membrane protein assembly factor BamD n=1 Tax=Thiomicrorhabdus arctica TaxID=131540 RepID=UPI000A016FA5|nr:outer membrane protein assembly factor BamD [Thiomicrorhabdus arctica]